MLDAATMALLAKVKMLAKKIGVNVDLVKMGNEKTYAETTLAELSNADDPELVLIAVQLMNQLGLIGMPSAAAIPEPKKDETRYVGSLR
ncbi:MAG: hypothetical protein KJ850_07780 [Gammaproteobacteria bacterium]|nr:hypothetical protein [Gammaproteobacteria bacterium]MBU1624936.1 hypothetical protein [Gammaproteobacteria bacterium]MBU1982235.1 hypothetical protein [Gammaproteobacteria bacterium]